jgi:DNA polymerase-3 subunit alpha
MQYFQFPCGCRWPVIGPPAVEGGLPLLDFDAEKIPEDCSATWALLGRGETKGVFQLESQLGKVWTKKLAPENLEHITALGAILRPGCLKAMDKDGISMTEHYCLRKKGQEEVKSYHPAIDPILFPTYNILVYQEQAMAIARAVAGFDMQQADTLRKAIGKKLPEEMVKCKKLFMEGAQKAGIISQEMAQEVFGWIEKSQRYSFNKSHACCYGLTGYECAYIKAHFPLAFFTSWLYNARHKQDPRQEIAELVSDAKLFKIEVEGPDLRSFEQHFHTDGKVIRFGISDIKGVGPSGATKIREAIETATQRLGKPISQWTWSDFLYHCSSSIYSSVMVRLIEVGALRWLGRARQELLADYRVFNELTDKEKEWFTNPGTPDCFLEALTLAARDKKQGGACSTKKRVEVLQSHLSMLKNPPSRLWDSPQWVAYCEEEHLGLSLSCSRMDSCDISAVNCSLSEYISGRTGFMVFGVEVRAVREITTRKGKNPGQKMAFLTLADSSCMFDEVVCFPEEWKQYSHLLNQGNLVILQAERDHKKGSSTMLVKKVWQAVQK